MPRIAPALLVVAALAGCGGDKDSTTAQTSTPAPTAAASPAVDADFAPLKDIAVKGYRTTNARVVPDAKAMARLDSQPKEAKRLEAEGFGGGYTVDLVPTDDENISSGYATATRLRDHAAAKVELKHAAALSFPDTKLTVSAIPGLPGGKLAVLVPTNPQNPGAGRNVYVVRGRTLYFIGAGVPDEFDPGNGTFIAALKKLVAAL